MRRAILVLVCAAFLPARSAVAAPGDLDPSFGSGGRVSTPISPAQDYAFDLVLQPDGKVAAAGYSSAAGDFALTRYDASGVLDPSFGIGGIVLTDFGAGLDIAHAAERLADGRLLVAGSAAVLTAGGRDMALARYIASGDPDPTFGAGGRVVTPVGASVDEAFDVAILSDGRIVVAGVVSVPGMGTDFVVARYLGTGALDPTFGNGGIVTTDTGSHFDQANALVVQGDGKIVIAGSTSSSGCCTGTSIALLRYEPNGDLDAAFGSGGIVVTGSVSGDTSARDVLQDPDGKLVVAAFGGGATLQLLRYQPDGALDAGFGGGGRATLSSANAAHAVVRQANGRLVAVGSAGSALALARFEADGTPNASFGVGGLVTTTFAIGAAEGRSVGVQADGRIVVAGFAGFTGPDSDFVLARYLGDPGPVCGNGTVESPEACDDGDTEDGDCCSATCALDAAGAACTADADPCSNDVCDGAGACVHPAVPAPSCRAPIVARKSTLSMIDKPGASADVLSWKWTTGAATTGPELGDPTTATGYALCVYDEIGGVASIALRANVPPGGMCDGKPCWRAAGDGFKYKSRSGAADGITAITLKPGAAGKAKIALKGKGTSLLLPVLPLAADPGVTVQLRSNLGACFGARFSTPSSNDVSRFKARSD